MTAAFGKMPTPVAPKEPEQVRLPSPDDPELAAQRRKQMQEEMTRRQGRKSTELATDKGPSYSRTTLG